MLVKRIPKLDEVRWSAFSPTAGSNAGITEISKENSNARSSNGTGSRMPDSFFRWGPSLPMGGGHMGGGGGHIGGFGGVHMGGGFAGGRMSGGFGGPHMGGGVGAPHMGGGFRPHFAARRGRFGVGAGDLGLYDSCDYTSLYYNPDPNSCYLDGSPLGPLNP